MSLFPIFAPHSPDATVVYTDYSVDATNSTSYTFSSSAIGTASSNRKIVVGPVSNRAPGTTATAVTVGGISATSVIGQTSNNGEQRAELWEAEVPTGTTADIVVTWAATADSCGIGVWAVYDAAASASDTASDDGVPTLLEENLTIPAGGVAISVACSGSSATYTWTNLTEKYDATVEGTVTFSGASDAFSTLQTSLLITATRSAGTTNGTIVMAAWDKA